MRKRYKIPIAALLTFFGIVTTGVLIFTQTPLLRMELNRSLKNFLREKYRLEVKIGGLSGNGFSELLLTDVSIDYQHPAQPYRLLHLDTLFARYKAADFFRRKWEIDSLYIGGAQGVILSDSAGQLLLPSLAGEGKGAGQKAAFEVADFSIHRLAFKLFLPTRSWEISSGQAEGSLKSDGERLQFALERLAFALPADTLRVKRARLAGSQFENSIDFDSFYIATDSSEIFGKGKLTLKPKLNFEAQVRSTSFSFLELKRLTGLSLSGDLAVAADVRGDFGSFGGTVQTSGRFLEWPVGNLKFGFQYRRKELEFRSITGRIAGADWNGAGRLDWRARPPQWEYRGAVENFDLNQLVKETMQSRLSGEVEVAGIGLSGKDLQIELSVNLGAGHFYHYPFSTAAGQVSVNAGETIFLPGFAVTYLNSSYQFSGRVGHRDSASVSGSARFADLKDFWEKLFIKKLAGTGASEFSFSGLTNDFDVRGNFRSDSLYLYDIYSKNFSADFDLKRFLTRRKGDAAVRFGSGRVYAVPLDSATIDFRLDSNLVDWDSATAFGPKWKLSASGRLDIADSLRQKLSLPDAELVWNRVPFRLGSPALLTLVPKGVKIEKGDFKIADGDGSATGFIGYNDSLDLKFSSAGVSLPNYYTFLERTEEPLSGRAGFSGQLSGFFEKPELAAEIRLDSLKRKKLLLGNLSGNLEYAAKKMNFWDFRFESPYGSYRLAGYFPLDLALARGEERILDEPLNFTLSASGQRFDLLNLALADVENLSGDFKLDLTATGTPERPEFAGEMNLKNGRLKLLELENPIENLETSLNLVNNRLLVRSFAGTTRWRGKTGKVSAGGAVELTSLEEFGYDLWVKGEKFPFSYEFDAMEGVADFDLTVKGQTPPEVAGKINLLSITYSGDFAEESRTTIPFTSAELSSKWDFNLQLVSLNNWWVKTSDVDAELKGDLYVLRRGGIYNFLGDLETIRGKYALLGNSFRIERGVIKYDDIAEANPKLDIAAVAKIRPPRDTSEVIRQPDIELRILIGGTLDQPEVKPDPASPYTEQDIVFLLTTGRANPDSAFAGTGGGLTQRLSIGGLSLAAQAVQRAAARTLGVETIEFAPEGNGNLLESRLTVGKYALPGLYIYGSSPLSTLRGQELGFEYSLGKRFYLEGIKDRNNLYRFNLNLRWEY